MEPLTAVTIHSSRYPGRARAAYLESFRMRRMNHQFHYESEKQAQRWLAIHEAYSPARRDQDCLDTYAAAFAETASIMGDQGCTVFSLGCGGGQKDLALLSRIKNLERIQYVPTDVSLTLALTAHLAAQSRFQGLVSKPGLLDLKEAKDLETVLVSAAPRLILFFGMLPNFEAEDVLPQLARALRPQDRLLMSANLAPNYDLQTILPQYDNDLTRRWLATVLIDAGIEMQPGDIEFRIGHQGSLQRIEAGYRFSARQRFKLDGEEFVFEADEWFRLFFSYRHTPSLLRDLLAPYQLEIVREWVAQSEEEGVFLLKKRQA